MPAPSSDARATLRDGATVAYTLRPATIPAPAKLVLIHSLAMDRTIWDELEAALPDVDVLTYDARGHGASDVTPGPYSAAQFADDLADLLDAVGWKRAIVAGASMGGSVAIAFAVAYPERVSALGLFDTTAWYGADAPAGWSERAQKARTDGFAAMTAFQQTRWFSDAFRARRPEVVARLSGIFVRNDVDAYAAHCEMLGAFDARAGLAGITVPTEILVGEEDYATPPEMSQALRAAIPGARLTVIAGARHLTIVETPERVADAVRTLIARSEGAALADRR